MIAEPLQRVLESTGYLHPGQRCGPGVRIGPAAQEQCRGRQFRPDARWEGQSALRVYFKYVEDDISADTIGAWRREIWNEGRSPLLWTVSPQRTVLYNAFGRPQQEDDAEANRLKTFQNTASELERLDSFAGKLAMETGQFWRNESSINRATGVDQQLLSDLAALERDLVTAGLGRLEAQGLIGRCIFTQYLIDRRIIGPDLLQSVCGQPSLPRALDDPPATQSLFDWLSQTFNGDMFPMDSTGTTPGRAYLERVAQFLRATDPRSGQQSLFPYQFDIIPVELISSIYEQFARAAADATGVGHTGIHYTRLSTVSLVLDEVLCEANGSETVLDLTCGSGVFLVEALRRLVRLRSGGAEPTREIVRSTLHEQVFGVDIEKTAIPVEAFSLYLAALELDPDPTPPDAFKFDELIGTSLFVGDAKEIPRDDKRPPGLTGPDGRTRKFDVIVGNPPWDFKGKTATEARHSRETPGATHSPRGESLDFVDEARRFADEDTRFGLILSALPFFSGSGTGQNASLGLLQSLAPVTLVNLSNLKSWLFPNAKMPAAVLFARQHSEQHSDQLTVVQVPWTESGERTHAFEIAARDILKIPLSSVQHSPELLKAAAFGRHHDLQLLDRLKNRLQALDDQLDLLGSKLNLGLIFGDRGSVRDTRSFRGLPFLDKSSVRRFAVEPDLPLFEGQPAQRPRSRETYRAPLLLIKKSLTSAEGPRLVASATDHDTVFTEDYFGASLPRAHRASVHLLTGILNSALASWFFVMTSSTLGLWINRLFLSDLNRFPVPELGPAVESANGRRVIEIAASLQQHAPTGDDWHELDQAVFELYELDQTERIVVQDGLVRAGWLWQRGQRHSAAPATTDDLRSFARAFLGTMDAWFSARNVRRMRAEIFKLSASAPLRVIRFVLEERPGPSILETLPVEGSLSEVLSQIGERFDVPIADALAGARELRVYDSNEVVIIKPSARRHWMGVRALEDANEVVAKSISGAVPSGDRVPERDLVPPRPPEEPVEILGCGVGRNSRQTTGREKSRHAPVYGEPPQQDLRSQPDQQVYATHVQYRPPDEGTIKDCPNRVKRGGANYV